MIYLKNNKWLHQAAYVLLWVGGLNWGLVGLFDFNLVETLLGTGTTVTMVAYVLVGLSAVYTAFTHMSDCRVCNPGK